MRIINNFPLSFQIGRSIFNLSVKYPCTIFPCFRAPNLSVDDDYQNLNFPFVKMENNNVVKIQEIDNDESDCFSSVNNNLETERVNNNFFYKKNNIKEFRRRKREKKRRR